jgi:hypothetical protein
MGLKLLVCGICLIMAYLWRSQRKNDSLIEPTIFSFILFSISTVLIVAALRESIWWVYFWSNDPFQFIPFDAAAIGVILGIIFSDIVNNQNITDINADSPDKSNSLESIKNKIWDLGKGIAIGLPLSLFALAAITPGSFWFQLMSRVQEVKAGSVALSLRVPLARDAATSVRTAAPPRDILGNQFLTEVGFVPQRMSQLQALTYPAASNRSSSGRFTLDPFTLESATELILSAPASSNEVLREVRNSHLIERDRAMMYLISMPQSDSVREELTRYLEEFAKQQQEMLVFLRQHVTCLSTVVDMTRDRRLIDYANFPNVEKIVSAIHIMARAWSGVEKIYTMSRQFEGNVRVNSPISQIRTQQDSIVSSLNSFNGWAIDYIPARTFHIRADISREIIAVACPVHTRSPAIFPDLRAGFSPYLTLFAAHLLSAIGDHISAVRLLADWLIDDEEISAADRQAGSEFRAPLNAWMRLRVYSQLATIQRLSEGQELAVPARAEMLRHLISIYEGIIANQPLSIWSSNETQSCLSQPNSWRQALMLSYYLYIKEYLDNMNIRPSVIEDIRSADFNYARTLATVNTRCFSRIFQGDSAIEQSAQFVLTYIATGLSWIASRGAVESEKISFVREARLRLRDIIGELERMPGRNASSRPSPIEELIYGRTEQHLLEAARALKLRLESLDPPA